MLLSPLPQIAINSQGQASLHLPMSILMMERLLSALSLTTSLHPYCLFEVGQACCHSNLGFRSVEWDQIKMQSLSCVSSILFMALTLY